MLDKLTSFIRDMKKKSADFSYKHEQGSPADSALLRSLEEAFAHLGQKPPPSLLKFYETCNGFTLRWEYNKLTHPDYLTSGDVEIYAAELLISALYSEPPDPVRFDYSSDLNQVMLKPGKSGLTLVYRSESKGKDFPMSIDLEEYFRLLDESRGLYPWRELFIKAKSFRLDPALKDKFFADLKLLFKDADAALFKRK